MITAERANKLLERMGLPETAMVGGDSLTVVFDVFMELLRRIEELEELEDRIVAIEREMNKGDMR